MTVQIQQISTWRSAYGSEMGDPVLPQQQASGLDKVIPTMMIMQYQQQPVFKKPLAPVRRFQVPVMPAVTKA